MIDALRAYLQLASGLAEVSAARAKEAATSIVAQGAEATKSPDVVASGLSTMAEDFVEQSKTNSEILLGLIKTEVDRAVGRMGFVREEELAAVRRHVQRLEAQLTSAPGQAVDAANSAVNVATVGAKSAAATAKTAANVAATAARTAPKLSRPTPVKAESAPAPAETAAAPAVASEEQAPVRKAPAKKAPAKKAAAKKAPAKATAKKAPAKRAAKKAPAKKA